MAIMGDINENVFKSSTICNLLTGKGYSQHVKQPTTQRGTLIDHVYFKSLLYEIEAIVLPTYFSDHEAVLCSFRALNN